MWGQTAAAHYSIQRGTATRLSQMPEAAEVLTLLNSQKLLKTAYRFPLEMKLNGSDLVPESDDYDPRFILVSLAHILSSEYAVQCARFSQSGAISLLFSALSSPCGEVTDFIGFFPVYIIYTSTFYLDEIARLACFGSTLQSV